MAMAFSRQFEWDDEKAADNFAKHGITFESATRVFLDSEAVYIDASHPEDGEERYKVIGVIEGRLYVAVYTIRGETYRLISARRTNRKEEKLWFASR